MTSTSYHNIPCLFRPRSCTNSCYLWHELWCPFKKLHTTAHLVSSLLLTKLMNEFSHILFCISSKHVKTDHSQDHLKHLPKSNNVPHHTTSAIYLHWYDICRNMELISSIVLFFVSGTFRYTNRTNSASRTVKMMNTYPPIASCNCKETGEICIPF